jgi:hypothetical protein
MSDYNIKYTKSEIVIKCDRVGLRVTTVPSNTSFESFRTLTSDKENINQEPYAVMSTITEYSVSIVLYFIFQFSVSRRSVPNFIHLNAF